jgi:hypothetical protein
MNLSVSEVAAIGGALVVGQVGIAVIIDVVKSKVNGNGKNGKAVCSQHTFLEKRLDGMQEHLTHLVKMHEEEKQVEMISKALEGVLKGADEKTLKALKNRIM